MPQPAYAELESVPCRSKDGGELTTMACGGVISSLFEPRDVHELVKLLTFFAERRIEPRILGAGSNVLVPDSGIDVPVIRLGAGFRHHEVASSGFLKVGAAHSLMGLSRFCAQHGLAGLEFAGGIPASIGGAVRMNAGAHGGQMSDVVTAITFAHPGGRIERVPSNRIAWEYRRCGLPEGVIVIEAEIQLSPGDPKEIQGRRTECLNYRKRTQPLQLPSSGSVFRNPEGERAAGWYIEQAGLKGLVHGGAAISSLHANWIVNPERNAAASDVQALVRVARETVAGRFGVVLVPELVIW